MSVRSSMAALIARERILLNDVLGAGSGQVFSDQTIQDVMDEGRSDIVNLPLIARPTFIGSTVMYLEYYWPMGGWEDDLVLKQYLTVPITPSVSEPIAGHWSFAQTTLPPVYITGKLFDVYRSAADLLERQAAQWTLAYATSMDGQTLNRQQVIDNLLKVVKAYRLKQRARTITLARADLQRPIGRLAGSLGPQNSDYFASGDGH